LETKRSHYQQAVTGGPWECLLAIFECQLARNKEANRQSAIGAVSSR